MNFRLLLPVVALFSLSGCIVLKHNPHTAPSKGSQKSGLSSRPSCDSNQYWDGEKCRHKGKGKGARKHDD
jgi:hypothetical protein